MNARSSATPELYRVILGSSGPTIVFLPGLGGTTRYWEQRVIPLQGRYRIVLVDLLGFGNSPKPWIRYDVDAHVDALHRALEDLGPISIVGHSLGAMLAVAYAARYHAQIQSMTLIGLPYFGSARHAYKYLRHGPVRGGYFYTNTLLAIAVCIFTRRVIGWLLPYVLKRFPKEVAEDLVKHTWRSSTSSLWSVVYGYDLRRDFRDLEKRIRVLLIHGAQDVIAPLGPIRKLAELRPGTRLEIFPDSDHHPFLQETNACLKLVGHAVRVSDEITVSSRSTSRGLFGTSYPKSATVRSQA